MPAPMTMSEINAMEFFHGKLKDDGIHFTWAHAVNDYSKLKSSLKGIAMFINCNTANLLFIAVVIKLRYRTFNSH